VRQTSVGETRGERSKLVRSSLSAWVAERAFAASAHSRDGRASLFGQGACLRTGPLSIRKGRQGVQCSLVTHLAERHLVQLDNLRGPIELPAVPGVEASGAHC
jgi:hypothetical protein